MNDLQPGLPSSVIRWLAHVPRDRPVVLLLRHAEREALPVDGVGYGTPITKQGKRLSIELGANIGCALRSIRTSPLARCIQTAEGICDGSGQAIGIECDRFLGDPGVFVEYPDVAWENWQVLGNDGMMAHLATSDDVLPGMAHPGEAARSLLQHMFAVAGDVVGLHVFVTHDVLLATTAARLIGPSVVSTAWPGFLEGLYCWEDELGGHLVFRTTHVSGLSGLCEERNRPS